MTSGAEKTFAAELAPVVRLDGKAGMTVNLDEMRALVDRLNETAYQYYVLDNPTISDRRMG